MDQTETVDTKVETPADNTVDNANRTQNGESAEAKAQKPRKRRNLENEKLRSELNDLNDKYLRSRAEFENYRRRTKEEQNSSFSNGVAKAVDVLLPALDTLVTAAGAGCSDPDYKKGVELIIAKFESSFKTLGIEEIQAQGEMFDPALHNAVSKEYVEGMESGTIIRVLQKGYHLGERVIRHASVTVAQ